MKREPLVICGLTPFAGMVAHYFETLMNYEVVAFTAHERFIRAPVFEDRPIIPVEQLAGRFAATETRFFAAIEYKWLNSARVQVMEELKKLGLQPASFIHPTSSVCPTAQLGEHCFLMEGVSVGYRSTLGSNNIVHPRTHIGHHARIGSHNYLCAGTLIDRSTEVGDYCYLGPGTTVAGEGCVGDWCYTRPRQEVFAPLPRGTTFNPCLRAPGYVVDRRHKADSPLLLTPAAP